MNYQLCVSPKGIVTQTMKYNVAWMLYITLCKLARDGEEVTLIQQNRKVIAGNML